MAWKKAPIPSPRISWWKRRFWTDPRSTYALQVTKSPRHILMGLFIWADWIRRHDLSWPQHGTWPPSLRLPAWLTPWPFNRPSYGPAIAQGGAKAHGSAMATEIEFSFKTLTGTAQRHIRVFQIHQFLDRFVMGLTVAVVALALTDRGMDLLQISLLFGIYSLTTMALELPFGGLADNIGRKPVFLVAVIASLISLVLFLSSSDFTVLALALNRFAIAALVAVVAQSRDLFLGLLGWEFAVGRGDFASVDRGFSHEHSAIYKCNTPSGAHDRGYVGAQFGTGIAGWTFARLQTFCGLVRSVTGYGHTR
ncbi:MFS transporter [Phaeobacter inhibens]|uniref:MFS transporter n=1 Tax=Phaeobacter inhibens TaxID=221822 RepID=UPI001E4ACC1F|nr:MFS transporter [Phaeobacter inhibens]WHP69852.1 MFS transporter [Phaeobacter inhibens]